MNEINIGAVILDLRKKLGMTQEQLAEIVGVSPPAVSKWETGASCPDVALLAPIARALNTDMNTLLSFHAELPTEGLLDAVKEVQTLAEQDGPAAMERILTLTRRYPTDTHLRFQLSCLAMGLPQLYCWPEEAKEAAWDFAEQSFAYVRQHGEKNLWPTVTYMLAGLLLNRDKLDQAEELLDSLPVMPMSPQMLYAVLHQRRDQPEKAWAGACPVGCFRLPRRSQGSGCLRRCGPGSGVSSLPVEHPAGSPRHRVRQRGRGLAKAGHGHSGTERGNGTGSSLLVFSIPIPSGPVLFPHLGPDAAKQPASGL